MSMRSNYPGLYFANAYPALNALIYDEYEKVPNAIPSIFRMYNLNTWGEQSLTFAGIAPAAVKNEGEEGMNDSPIEGYATTYIPITYAVTTAFSEEIIEDNRLSQVEDTYRSLGMSMGQTEQIVCWNIFNDGFVTAGPDGVSLLNTAHPMIGGHLYGNRPGVDVALSVAGLREMEVDMMRQVNHRNINITVMPKNVIVPPELSHIGKELLKSVDRPDTPNRSMNTFYGENYNLIVVPFLTSVRAWYATADKNQHQLRFYDRIAATTKTWVDDPTGDVKTRIRRRFDVKYSDFIGTWGTTG